MDSIDEVHVCEPGLVVLDITAREEETAVAVMSRLDELWATSGIGPVRRVAAEPGVRARLYADIRRPGSSDPV
ncbi:MULTISPECIES: DUF6207 family protein [Streptomyces]|uniref:DUF6207 family protein n=1 Tax=Streptomyces yatensis TaxID=155177 RepID=A0ABN2JNC7_9ACTN|nr:MULTISPECIES: DUF6207 family protein [Streptomyces]MCG0284082.1 DUF6207 family protein [Streptomyces sp. PSAA01]